jgi:hypothetical protein
VQTVAESRSEKQKKSSVSCFCYFVIIFTISQSDILGSDVIAIVHSTTSICAKINAAIMRQILNQTPLKIPFLTFKYDNNKKPSLLSLLK